MSKLGNSLKHVFDTFLLLKRLLLFIGFILVSIWLYHFFITIIVVERSVTFGVILLWFVVAYILAPRVHRFLSRIYLPNYFIGRTRTGDGLLGDPVNISIIGSDKQIKQAMLADNWVEADVLNAGSTFRMIKASLLRRSYPNAPVSSLYLFGQKQDFAFQQEVGSSTKKRHHVRFWKCPEEWLLPGGFEADYLAAATYDKTVGLSLYTLQFTHKIEEDTDIERDYVVASLSKAKHTEVNVVENFSTGYHCRNGGGDSIKTDGHMPFVLFKT